MFQRRVLEGDYSGKLGLALAHPLYIAAGRALTVVGRQHLPFLLNAFSGLGMAVALANLAALANLLTGKRWIGPLVAAMLAVSHTTWWLATIAEVYTWSVAGLTAEIWLLVALLRRPRWQTLSALALVSGLGLTIHNFALLPLPVYFVAALLLVLKKKLPAWSLAAAAAGYVIGSGLYLTMIVDLAIREGSLIVAIRSALFGNYTEQVLNVGGSSGQWKYNAALSSLNFVSFLAPLAIIGWARMSRRIGKPAAIAIGAITAVQITFFVRYPVPDQFTFILPTLVMIAVAAIVGAGHLASLSRRWRTILTISCVASILFQPVLFAAAPSLVRKVTKGPIRSRQLPFRDEVRYWLTPWKHNERSAWQFATAALQQASPNGVILPGSTAGPSLQVVQMLLARWPNVIVQFKGAPWPGYSADPNAFRATLGDRPLFVTSTAPGYVPAKLAEDAEFEPTEDSILQQVRWKNP